MNNEEKLFIILKDRIRRHYKHTWKKNDLLKFIDNFEDSIKVNKDE